MTERVFEKLFKTHYDALCHFAMGYLKDRDSSEGIVQEVFVTFWHKRESVDPQKSVKSYLYTAVKNRCLNYIRDHEKFRSYVLDVEIELEVPAREEQPFEAEELKKRIEDALDKLPPRCREVFEMSRFEEKKYQEK
jgi:RNA polymerase sigma-70 factor (ECF subfamily)